MSLRATSQIVAESMPIDPIRYNMPNRQQFLDTFGQYRLDQFDAQKQVELNGSNLSYVDFLPTAEVADNEQPIVVFPGFTEGLLFGAPFCAALADRTGRRVILPDCNRVKDSAKRNSGGSFGKVVDGIATILDRECISDFAAVTHSMGSLTLANLIDRRKDFSINSAVLMAPAGLNKDESLASLSLRFGKETVREMKPIGGYPDHEMQLMKAGLFNALKYPMQSCREVLSIAQSRIELGSVNARIGSLSVLLYNNDQLFNEGQTSELSGLHISSLERESKNRKLMDTLARELDSEIKGVPRFSFATNIRRSAPSDRCTTPATLANPNRPIEYNAHHNDQGAFPLETAHTVAQLLGIPDLKKYPKVISPTKLTSSAESEI
jgi:pimeloyl-ACP methyl ester carboxylesterase